MNRTPSSPTSTSSKLAIHGGSPTRVEPFTKWNAIGAEEEAAAVRVLKSGCLSAFLGTWSEAFFGGPEVRGLESEWAKAFDVAEAISVNSATSGLFAAMGAIGISPGDEVIVTPASMSASATAPLLYGGIPVFADISEDYTLDPESVRRCITPRTKAILAVHLFGYPADLNPLLKIARDHRLFLVEDNAQAPGALYQGRPTGTIGDIGVFSLNYHKHIHSGEGGVCTTNNPELANRLRLIRNHAEAVVDGKGEKELVNLFGFNYRMTELEAAIAREQLKKLPHILRRKSSLGERLCETLRELPGLYPPAIKPGNTHAFYVFPIRVVMKEAGFDRRRFVEALRAEGIPVVEHYTKPLYRLPLFQKKIAMGRHGFPFSLQPERSYEGDLCPTAERLYQDELCYIPWCLYDFSEKDVSDIGNAVKKIIAHRGEL